MRRIVGITLVWAMLVSCGGNVEGEQSSLYSAVPSRSVAVMHFDSCEDALSLLLDSTSVFRSLDYGRLGGTEAVLSYDYSAGLIPLLVLDAGRSSADTSAAVRNLLGQAVENKLFCLYTGEMLPKRSALLMSPSRALISEAEEHILSGTSIMDAEGFRGALALSGGSKGSVILRNGSATRLLPKNMLKDYFTHKDLARFFSGLCEWTVLNFSAYSREGISVAFREPGSARYLSRMLDGLEAGECRASSAVPDSADFILGLCFEDSKAYIQHWEECLDVRAELSRYKGRLVSLRKNYGKSPSVWWAEKAPKELVRVIRDGQEILLLRPGKKPKAAGLSENPCPGFIPALLGGAFRIADDSMCASAGGWTAFGSAEAVAAWLEAPKGAALPGIPRKAKYYLINPEFSVVADSKNTVLNVN